MLWKPWKTIKKGDYLYALIPEHPNATKNGYVLEHRAVLENKLGRLLEKNEEAHHVDENKKNNSPENIELKLKGEHQRFHQQKRFPEKHTVKLICTNCGKVFDRRYHNRPENHPEIKNVFCSRKCNGIYNGFKSK